MLEKWISPRWSKLTGMILLLIGVGALLLFIRIGSPGWKSLLLFIGVVWTLRGIFRLLILPLTSLPERIMPPLAKSAGGISGALYYTIHGQSVIWAVLSALILLLGIGNLAFVLRELWIRSTTLRALLKAYEEGKSPNLAMPLIYVLTEPGAGVKIGHFIAARTVSSMIKYRHSLAESKLPVRLDKITSFLWKDPGISFIVSDSLRRYPVSFRKWVMSQAAALMVIRTGIMMPQSLERALNDEAESGYQTCPGPTFMVYLRAPLVDSSPTPTTMADQTLEYTYMLSRDRHDKAIASLTDRLASTAVPIGVSDTQLTKEARALIQDVATSALPPIADCYLRLRLAQSDVERFLSLLEGLEGLVKCSVIVLLVNRWVQTGEDVSQGRLAGRPLALGAWIYFLRRLTDTVVPSELDEETCSFWRGDIFQIQKELISEVSKMGLSLPDIERTSQLDWLEWFRDLRNVTRGHGVVTEETVASLWHPFHEAFLEMISALKPFTLSSVIVAQEPKSGKQFPLKGWLRGGNRVGSQSSQEPRSREALTALKLPSGQLLPLHPLVIIRGNEVLLWDCVRKKEEAIEFLNYTSGERKQLAFSEFCDTDPYKIWLEETS